MDDDVWARHANPWSGWSRVSILPLFAIAVWSRVWIGWWAMIPVAIVLLWTWLNPRLFSPPASVNNWMTKGVLGEHIWLARGKDRDLAHHAPVIRNLTISTSAGTILLLTGLAVLNVPMTTTGLAITMLTKLWILDRMVWVYTEIGEGSASLA
ncbi:DUF6653 family protein [Yoonia sp.]|uniref:DUF6653 family protein n=1 Tax=Yoonia sp. TaxID=2212373 RepID=UPI00391B0E0B